MDAEQLTKIVATALHEDLGSGDITGGHLVDTQATGRIVTEQDLVVCGLTVAREAFLQVDPNTSVEIPVSDGEEAGSGQLLLSCTGTGAALLAAERVALNFLQRMCGIATLTRAYVNAVEGTGTMIADTRKTTPGLRMLEKYAVQTGGGHNHRMGLYDQVLVKENHIALTGSMAAAVGMARGLAGADVKVEVETSSMDEVEQALAAEADIIMLDNFSVEDMRDAVSIIDGKAIVEASGGVTLENVRTIAETRVNLISVGRLTHSAQAAEMSMDILPA